MRDSDKAEIVDVAKKYAALGFDLYATKGTAKVLERAGMQVRKVNKIHESEDNTMTLLESGKIQIYHLHFGQRAPAQPGTA